MSKALDSGKAFLDGILAKLPESLRESVKTALTAPEATDALTVLGDGVLARADYSRSMDAIKAKEGELDQYHQTLNGWYETNKSKLEEYDTLKAGKQPPVVPPATPPAIDDKQFVKADDLATLMQKEQLSAANFLALQNALTLQHYDRFKEVIDTRELLTDPNLGKQKADGTVYGLKDAYRTKYTEQLTKFETEQEAARIQKLVDAKVAEQLKGQPLPIPLKNGAPAPLDLLEGSATPDLSQYSAAAAAEEYARLQAGR